MTLVMLITVILGSFFGYYFVPQSSINTVETISTVALNLLILFVGIDVGSNKNLVSDIKENGIKLILIPISIAVGSIIGGIVASFICSMSLKSGISISAGFGWYSLSAVMLTNLENAEIGTIAFLTNVFREITALLIIPFVARKLNHYTAIAPAGATSMDTTLPVISKSTSPKVTIAAFISGVMLSSFVPVIISFLYAI
ncbi:lysine exporter LysO family protein [Clostridium niameyense]|uniref:Lysine exporter LysO family protein n=1 Tax=Clostridium niameyense TaxID=1622073 RepID=A0A6M0R9K1_9CLOT|nr:lysine exporter LysO family protein [Clostridium niameyense]NEZ46922.1 lysine exporter LysO family protein [Clostridium niameyense]